MTSAIILAGGMGTRLRSLVADVPKPMAEISGRPFLAWQMDYWIEQGVDNFILSLGYQHQIITDYFGNEYHGIPISYAIEEKPLGTGGGLLLAAHKLPNNAPFFAMNGDVFFAADMEIMKQNYTAKNADWLFALCSANAPNRYMGIELDNDGRVISLTPRTTKINTPANAGIYLINPKILPQFAGYIGKNISLEDEIVPTLLKNDSAVYGKLFTGQFIDIGLPYDYLRSPSVIKEIINQEEFC